MFEERKVEMSKGAMGGMGANKPQSDREKSQAEKHFEKLDGFKQTMISFNKGGSWEPLTPPKQNMDGKPYTCPKNVECHLHLNSHSTAHFGPFYTT